MKNTDPRVDAYIQNAPESTQPILAKLRKAFHAGESNIEKTIKWGVPHFDKGSIAGGFAAFKKHVGFGFWKAEAKRDTTREKRLSQAIEWMAEGKPRNWKYMNC